MLQQRQGSTPDAGPAGRRIRHDHRLALPRVGHAGDMNVFQPMEIVIMPDMTYIRTSHTQFIKGEFIPMAATGRTGPRRFTSAAPVARLQHPARMSGAGCALIALVRDRGCLVEARSTPAA